jgi:hypothetical protein
MNCLHDLTLGWFNYCIEDAIKQSELICKRCGQQGHRANNKTLCLVPSIASESQTDCPYSKLDYLASRRPTNLSRFGSPTRLQYLLWQVVQHYGMLVEFVNNVEDPLTSSPLHNLSDIWPHPSSACLEKMSPILHSDPIPPQDVANIAVALRLSLPFFFTTSVLWNCLQRRSSHIHV